MGSSPVLFVQGMKNWEKCLFVTIAKSFHLFLHSTLGSVVKVFFLHVQKCAKIQVIRFF